MKLKYPIFKQLPFLLPFAWVYRWIATIFTKKEKIKNLADNANQLNDENIEETRKIYDITGTPRD